MKVNANASIDEHFRDLRLEGETYLAKALRNNPSPVTRQRLLIASLRYLELRARAAGGVQLSQASQASQGVFLSQSVAGSGPKSSFQTLLASSLDHDIATEVLIEACAKAVDCQLLPILVKCLFILVSTGSICDGTLKNEDEPLLSPSQYNDDELVGIADSDEENVNPELNVNKQQLKHSSTSVGTNRKLAPGRIGVGRTGQSFVDEFVSKLASNLASKSTSDVHSNALFVSSVAREAPLSDSAAANVLQLLTARIAKVDLFELPPFIYQLLLLASSRGNSESKNQVLLQISQVFQDLEKKTKHAESKSQNMLEEDEDAILESSISSKELRQIQGTALLHIEYAVKQDPSLFAEIVKLTKSGVEMPVHFLTSFGTGIVLSLARASTTHADVLHVLRDTILRFEREIHLRKSNLYNARVSMNDEPIIDLCKTLVSVADCTLENGWDNVKESLVNFAFLLLDKPLLDSKLPESDMGYLGEKLLSTLFKAHSAIRGSILEQLTTRIALQEKSSDQAISVIRRLAQSIPFYVLEHSQYIRDGIEFLTTLPPWTASSLIHAYSPLLVARQDLRDYFQLVMRKSLFHRDSGSRAVAVIGFLVVMRLHDSQVGSQSARVSDNNFSSEVVLDALQPLRRVFSYSAPLRAFLYKTAAHQIHASDSGKTKAAAAALSELLRTHLQTYVKPQDAPYVLLDHCVNESVGGALIEPLGDLMWCIAVVELKQNPDAYNKSCIIDLARKVASVSIQDFAVSKQMLSPSSERDDDALDDNNNPEEAAARANRNKMRVLGSVCEALINAVLIIPTGSQEWSVYSTVLVPLLVLKGKVFELLRGAGASSFADAFADLGGDLGIERVKPGIRMQLQRGVRTSGKGKKPAGSRKQKSGESGTAATPVNSQVMDHRFGSFSVLASAASKPALPLKVTMRLLLTMSDATRGVNGDAPNIFKGHVASRDFEELRVYLFAIAHKHIEDLTSSVAKRRIWDAADCMKEFQAFSQAVEDLVRLAMADFKRCRRSTSNNSGPGGVMALQIACRCTCALSYLAGHGKKVVASFCRALVASPFVAEDMTDDEVFEASVEALEKLVESLTDDEMVKEASIALRMHDSIVQSVVETLEDVDKRALFLGKRVSWAIDVFSNKAVSDLGIVRTLVQSCLVYTENNNDLRRAGHLCGRLLEVIGDCDEDASAPEKTENEKLCSAVSVEKETSMSVVDGVLDVIERAIVDVEWCLGRMTSLEGALGTTTSAEDNNGGEDESLDALSKDNAAKQAIRAEDAAQLRLEGVVRTLTSIARCAIAKWGQQERLLKLITKTYKLVCMATQAQVKRRGDPRTSFTSLINECKALAPTLWTYLAFAATEAAEEDKGKGASRAAKEARVMPQLIYEVERFEKVLIAAQKRTKVNLLRGMTRNIARDFRIREDKLRQEESSQEQGRRAVQQANERRADSREDDGSVRKRRRVGQ